MEEGSEGVPASAEPISEGVSAPAEPIFESWRDEEFPEFDVLELLVKKRKKNSFPSGSTTLKTTDLAGRPVLLTVLKNIMYGTWCGYLIMDPCTCEELGIHDWEDTDLWRALFWDLRYWNYAEELPKGGLIKVGFSCNDDVYLDAGPWNVGGIPRDNIYVLRMLQLMALMIRTEGFSLHSKALDLSVVQRWLDLAKRIENESLSAQRLEVESLQSQIDSCERFSIETNEARAHLKEDPQ